MIILWVAKGHAWTSDTSRSMTQMHDKSTGFIAIRKGNIETTTSVALSDLSGGISYGTKTDYSATLAVSKYNLMQKSQVMKHV